MSIIYNRERLRELFFSFHSVTGLRIAVFDRFGCEIAAYPQKICDFCAYIRKNPDIYAMCCENDRRALKKCISKPYVYRCHMGLFEAAAPISCSGELLGYIMIGQMLDDNDDNRKIVLSNLKKYFEPTSESLDYFNNIVKLPREKMESSLRLMTACTAYILTENIISNDKDSFGSEFLSYIGKHLDEKLDIMTLCSVFSMGKTTLCKKVKEETGLTVSKIILQKRIDAAKNLLIQPDMSVSKASLSVGIDDYNYFTKLFKAETGLTPSEFKLKNRVREKQ